MAPTPTRLSDSWAVLYLQGTACTLSASDFHLCDRHGSSHSAGPPWPVTILVPQLPPPDSSPWPTRSYFLPALISLPLCPSHSPCFSHTGLLSVPPNLQAWPCPRTFAPVIPSAWSIFPRHPHSFFPHLHQACLLFVAVSPAIEQHLAHSWQLNKCLAKRTNS